MAGVEQQSSIERKKEAFDPRRAFENNTDAAKMLQSSTFPRFRPGQPKLPEEGKGNNNLISTQNQYERARIWLDEEIDKAKQPGTKPEQGTIANDSPRYADIEAARKDIFPQWEKMNNTQRSIEALQAQGAKINELQKMVASSEQRFQDGKLTAEERKAYLLAKEEIHVYQTQLKSLQDIYATQMTTLKALEKPHIKCLKYLTTPSAWDSARSEKATLIGRSAGHSSMGG